MIWPLQIQRLTLISGSLWRATFTRPMWAVSLFTSLLRGTRWMASGGLLPKPFFPKSSVMDPAYCLCYTTNCHFPQLASTVIFPLHPPISLTLHIKPKNSLFLFFIMKRTFWLPCNAQSTFNYKPTTNRQLSVVAETLDYPAYLCASCKQCTVTISPFK